MKTAGTWREDTRYDWAADGAQSPYLIGEFVEIKTVWHPIGA